MDSVFDVERGQLDELRVLIVHDWIASWAGSERVVEAMLDALPGADLVVGLVTDDMRDHNAVTRCARETWLARLPGARRHHRWFVPLEALAFATLDTSGYDLVVSSSHAFAKLVRRPPRGLHVCYCHSPPRYLWDLGETYRRRATPMQRLAFAAGAAPMRYLDRRSARGVDHFIANSRYIASRIKRAYGRTADIVFPPAKVKAELHRSGQRDDFLLSLGRLVPYKRTELAVRAATQLGVRLVVAGDGPERAALERIAGPTVEFIGAVSDAEAARLLATCSAFVFCAEEDFGIAPVEANAHGAPVIGYGRGGLGETMVAGVTAELFDKQDVDAVVGAVVRARARRWDDAAIRANAERFSPARFRRDFLSALSRVAGSRHAAGLSAAPGTARPR